MMIWALSTFLCAISTYWFVYTEPVFIPSVKPSSWHMIFCCVLALSLQAFCWGFLHLDLPWRKLVCSSFFPSLFIFFLAEEFGSTLIFIFTDYFEEHWYSGSSDVWWDAAVRPSSSWFLHWAAVTSSIMLSMIDFFSFLDSCNDCVSKKTVHIFQSIKTFFKQRVLFFIAL